MSGGLAVGVGPGANAGLLARLTPYQVGLCSMLVRYVQCNGPCDARGLGVDDDDEDMFEGGVLGTSRDGDEEELARLFEVLRREVQVAKQPHGRDLKELGRELSANPRYAQVWEELLERLLAIDSPDALVDIFQDLEAAVVREPTISSPLHANGIFGQFARCCILVFKDASFEATVKLYDAVRDSATEACGDISMTDVSLRSTAAPGPRAVSMGTLQMEQLAKGLMRDMPLSFGRVPFPVIDAALTSLQGKLPLCHIVHFLRYVNSLEHRFADDAASRLRAFHDGHQQRGLAELRVIAGWPAGAPLEDGLPDLIQHSCLALAGLHLEMRHLDDALQAVGESIRAAQEASDGGCLCACLYTLSLVLLQARHTGKAFVMMRRCLHRAEALGLPALQMLCCLGIAHTLSIEPALADRRKRSLLWKESVSKMALETQPATMLRAASAQQGGAAGLGGVGAGIGSAVVGVGGGSRVFGFSGGGVGAGARGGLGVLSQLLGNTSRDDGSGEMGSAGKDSGEAENNACRDALAHVTLASQLSTQAGVLGETRPRVLLCQAEIARLFGLQQLTTTACRLVLEVYDKQLSAEDRALALCQLATQTAERSFADSQPLLKGVAKQLPFAGHLWAHIVGPRLVQTLIRAGECDAASALLFQAVGALRAVPQGSAVAAAQRVLLTNNSVRLYHRQLLPAYQSAREAISSCARGGAPGDICSHLLCLADVHLAAHDVVGALGPCLRCLSVAEGARLLQYRAEAQVRLARVKLEMRHLTGALQLAEEVTPQLSEAGSTRGSLRGEALLVQADVLFALISQNEGNEVSAQSSDADTRHRLLQAAATALRGAVAAFEAVADLSPLRRCRYLLARACHELGDTRERDMHAASFRRLSMFLDGGGCGTFKELGLAGENSSSTACQMEIDHAPAVAAPASFSLSAGAPDAGEQTVDGSARTNEPAPSGLRGGDASSDGCPALAQLLALAEAEHASDCAVQTPPGPPGSAVDPLQWLCSQRGARPSRLSPAPSLHTAVGEIDGLYPMAMAVLGA